MIFPVRKTFFQPVLFITVPTETTSRKFTGSNRFKYIL